MGSGCINNLKSTHKFERGNNLEELVENSRGVVRIVNEDHSCIA